MTAGPRSNSLPAHRVELHDGWSLWRPVWLRGAGFPARLILDVAAPAAAAASDALARASADAACARAALIAAVELVPASKPINKAVRALQRGEVPPGLLALADVAPLVEALEVAERAHTEARRAAEACLAAAAAHTGGVLEGVVRDPRFREALRWQNRQALRAADWLLAHPGETHTRARQNQQLIASYLQRYCVKNDTIGFFGPVAWGDVGSGPAALAVTPGPALLDKRTVYFEHWCIDALAQVFAEDPALRPALRPRRLPTVRLEGRTVIYPVARRSELPAPYAALLALCDGVGTAREIAAVLLASPELELDDEAEVFDMLAALVEKRFCTWTLEIPTVTEWPERHLRALLEGASGEVRERALAALSALEARREQVQAAAGDPARLDDALGELESRFQALTQQAATRKGGEVYAGRTLVFEDTRRALALDIGAPLLARLGPPLGLLLESARWYTHRIAALYREALVGAFAEVAAASAGEPSRLDFLAYWARARELFPEGRERSPLIARAVAELQARWSALVTWSPDARRVELSSATLAPAVRAAFAAPHPGWPGARYHAPDVMIAAPSVDAIRAGGGQLILGELHPSVSTMHYLAQKEHPDRAALIRARELDLPRPIPWPVIPKEHSSRADHMWVSQHDFDIEFGTTRSRRDREHVLAVGELVVERDGDRVWVVDRGGRCRFEVVEFFGAYLSAAIATEFDMFAMEARLPRITIDDVVVVREQWRLAPSALGFATLEAGAAQLAAARAWARALGLPRWVFVKIPEEPKPMYVDLESPLYVEMLAKLIRKASRVTLSEMLPQPDEAWLPDAEGRTYTCELRLLAVDPTEWAPPGPT